MPDIESVKHDALLSTRDLLSHEMKTGRLNLGYRIEAEDEAGSVVYRLPLEEAFT